MPKIKHFSPDEYEFSQILTNIAKYPKKLWLSGELPSQRVPTIAIVGTRKPTPYGREVTYNLSFELAKRGFVIVSGLALGVDGIAHQAAVDAGGRTIAVLPSPVEHIYPRTHVRLAHAIVQSGGALISEYDTDLPVQRWNFIERNRIVTGLSDGLLITEAAVRSGTISTANFALEQGKQVMVVPGNITSPMSAGCNALLRVGASPVTNTDDILDALGLTDVSRQGQLPLADNIGQQTIIELIATGVSDGDELHEKSGLEAATFNQTLSLLEIEGKIRALGANQWMIRR